MASILRAVTGHAGTTGDVVGRGPQGDPGKDGRDGRDGADSTEPGPRGLKGDKGDRGDRGLPGRDSTVPGPAGKDGQDGGRGLPGRDGRNGRDGDTIVGPRGPQGDAIRGVTRVDGDLTLSADHAGHLIWGMGSGVVGMPDPAGLPTGMTLAFLNDNPGAAVTMAAAIGTALRLHTGTGIESATRIDIPAGAYATAVYAGERWLIYGQGLVPA